MENKTNTFVKIVTNTEQTINDSIQIGHHLRNGANRLFIISNMNDDQIVLKSLNGETTKYTQLSRKTFCQLYYRKNYDQIKNPNNFLREVTEAYRTGANRLIIKHS